MCLYPKIIRNQKYTPNKKNGGRVPPVYDERALYVPASCGNCIMCRKRKAREWQIRLLEDIKENKGGKFITLTFSNESIAELDTYITKKTKIPYIQPEAYDRDNMIATKGIRLFMERWRKEYKKSIRHWLITELGHEGTENIHIHGLIWTEKNMEEIRRVWKYGFVYPPKPLEHLNYVSEQTVNYITKYITKRDKIHKYYKAKILTSAGIGKEYTNSRNVKNNKFNESDTDETYRTRTGHKIAMPQYWRNKIYNDEEKEALWLHKLDKETRYVCGEKIDTSKGLEEYFKTLEYYKKLNDELGYGNDKINWSRKKYEEERRVLIINTRIQNAKNKNNK